MRNDFITDDNKLKTVLESDKAINYEGFKPVKPGQLAVIREENEEGYEFQLK